MYKIFIEYKHTRGLQYMGNLALIKNILSPRNHLLRGQNYNNNGYYFLLSFCGWGN